MSLNARATSPLRRRNIDSILAVVRQEEAVTRLEISQRTGLSVPTVTRVITNLLQQGVLKAADVLPVIGPGRPATRITWNPTSGYVVGVGISEHRIRTALADVAGNIVTSSQVATLGEDGGSLTLENVLCSLGANLFQAGIQPEQVVAIAIGVPGTVDRTTGMVLDAPNIRGWRNFDLRRVVQESYPYATILVENDVNYAALGEFTFLPARPESSLLFITFRKGIGAGIILNGNLYRGASGFAGEVGFMALGVDFLYNPDIGLGHLETIAGEASLLAELTTRYDRLEDLFLAAKRSDLEARRVVDKALAYYAVAVANIATFLDPDTVVVGGGPCAWPEYSLAELQRLVQQLIPSRPQITLSQFGEDATLFGALAQARIAAQRSLALKNVNHREDHGG